MEGVHVRDEFTVGPDGEPSNVTDYKLRFPGDFHRTEEPRLVFETDEDYIQTSFSLESGTTSSDIERLRRMGREDSSNDHGILNIKADGDFYQARAVLSGESGIGFEVTPKVEISDLLHTHSIREGEDVKKVDLFSAFDLWHMAAEGAERYWLVGRDVVWVLVNYYGKQYYDSVRRACVEMANKYDPDKAYDELLSGMVECANKCQYRLYKSIDDVNYELVS